MKIDVNEEGNVVLKEVYNGVLLETSEGNQLGICMRDGTFELTLPKLGRGYRINMKTGSVYDMQSIFGIGVFPEIDDIINAATDLRERLK